MMAYGVNWTVCACRCVFLFACFYWFATFTEWLMQNNRKWSTNRCSWFDCCLHISPFSCDFLLGFSLFFFQSSFSCSWFRHRKQRKVKGGKIRNRNLLFSVDLIDPVNVERSRWFAVQQLRMKKKPTKFINLAISSGKKHHLHELNQFEMNGNCAPTG